MADFRSPEGDFAKVEGTTAQPRKSGTPSVGFDNSTRGKRAEAGPGPGTPANSARIR